MTDPANILVIYNRFTSTDSTLRTSETMADDDTVTSALEVAKCLSHKHNVKLFEIDEKTILNLPKENFDLVFNLTEELGNLPKSDFLVASFLEKNKIPFTGSGSKTLALTGNKIETKKILLKNKIPTAKFYYLSSSEDILPEWLTFPLIVKPISMHCSIGISVNSVVEKESALREFIANQQEKYGELFFVEEYIEGREINVALLGNGDDIEVLPISEIIFSKNYPSKYKIVDFNAKWVSESDTYQSTLESKIPADLPEATKIMLEETAIEAFRLTGCHDYARVDFRVDKSGIPIVLEVNANQGISEDTGTVRSAKVAGYTYENFVEKIVRTAQIRLELVNKNV